MKSDLGIKERFLLELTEVLQNEEYLFDDILGSEADSFALLRNKRGGTSLEITLRNGAVYELALKEK